MNKEDLKKLGIEDEALIQSIIVLHGKDIEKFKVDLTTVTTELTNTKTQLAEAGETIEGFKKLDVEGVKKSADEWKAKAEQAQADAQIQLTNLKFGYALDGALTQAKAKNVKAVKALLKSEDLKLTEDGQIMGLTEQLEKIKTENDYLFESTERNPKFVAGGGDKSAIADAVVQAARQAAGLKTS
jgi:hypothetical protein